MAPTQWSNEPKIDGSHFVAPNHISFPEKILSLEQQFCWASQSPLKGFRDNFTRISTFSAPKSGMLIATF